MRRNISGRQENLGDEVIDDGAILAYHLADTHMDPEIYAQPCVSRIRPFFVLVGADEMLRILDSEKWDPSRYLPDREEDKKVTYGWLGWGVARHPCLGMRVRLFPLFFSCSYQICI